MEMSEETETPVQRIKRLLIDLDPRSDDWSRPTPKHPLAPYGQHSDPVAAWVNFREDLRAVLLAVKQLAGGDAP